MAEEPQPSNVQEGADPPDALPASAEDRKAAKAMSSLEANKVEEDSSVPKKEVDVKALNDAIRLMELGGEQKKPEKAKKEEAPKPLIKVDQADVALLVRSSTGTMRESDHYLQIFRLINWTFQRRKLQSFYDPTRPML